MTQSATQTPSSPPLEQRLSALRAANNELHSSLERVTAERESYRALYMKMLEQCRRLEQGLWGQKAERLQPDQRQLTLDILGEVLGKSDEQAPQPPKSEGVSVPAHTRRKKGTGRKPLPENLPRLTMELIPPEVEAEGLNAFERVREEVTETVELRPSSMFVVRMVRPIFVRKDRDRDRTKEAIRERDLSGQSHTEFFIAAPPRLPIERGKAGPALLADSLVRRFQDHLPYYRLESIYAREGLELARSTMCSWHEALAGKLQPLVDAMWQDALGGDLLCCDATGVLVQAKNKCKRGHFWVLVSPERHALFGFSQKHKAADVDALLPGYQGYLVADAHTVYDHLYLDESVTEVGCWSHARRYFFKALSSAPDEAHRALALINELFRLERGCKTMKARHRKRHRKRLSAPVVSELMDWAERAQHEVLCETPIAKALTYLINQKDALQRFLEDGRLPLSNNISERQLRRQAVGRKNWLFVGSADAGRTNACVVSLLASCQMHGIEPRAYLRDILVLLRDWPQERLLELAPVNWSATIAQHAVQLQLDLDVYWRAATIGVEAVAAALKRPQAITP